MKKTRRVSAQEGYDLWARLNDETPNPVVAMDARHTLDALAPKPDEHVLGVGCGSGRHLGPMIFRKQPGRRRLFARDAERCTA